MRTKLRPSQLLAILPILVASWLVAGCGGKANRPPASTTSDPPPPATTTVPQQTMPEGDVIAEDRDELIAMDGGDPLGIRALELVDINLRQPLADVPFGYDSAVLSADGRSTLDGHADTLKTYGTMTILIEGHCDERGTVEYNLALGERRANAVYNYLVSLGINASRLKTITYGKEFPFDPGHNEIAWTRNRRGHFEITAK